MSFFTLFARLSLICATLTEKFYSIVLQEPVAMSLKSLMLLVVVAISMHPSTSSPTISFAAIGKEKDNVIQALGGLKSQLLSPFAGIAKGLIGAKLGLAGAGAGLVKSLAAPKIAIASGIIGTKAGIAKGLLGAKLGLARFDQILIRYFCAHCPLLRTVLRPVVGIKRAKLTALRGLLDKKISLLDF